MDRMNRMLSAACTVLTATLMAGCAAFLAARGLGFEIAWLPVYCIAFGAAVIVQLGRRGAAFAIGAAAVLVVGFGAMLAVYAGDIAAMVRGMLLPGAQLDFTAHALAGNGVAFLLALLMGALFSGMVRLPGSVPFALMLLLAVVICALAVNEDISLWAALPGLIAGVAAFAVSADSRREGVRPMLLVPAAVLTVAALLLVPASRTTWEPMENLAQRIRSVVEDYIRFTEERMAFSINEKGYDHAGMVDDQVVAMLGGPADPTEDVVMRVEANSSLLLRGTIKRSYTGYSWVDDQVKARYLYYDFTHRGVRNSVFDAESAKNSEGFVTRSASVEMLAEGTSTLFVPAQMSEFEMGLADAVYYNSAGEIFLTRDVASGDAYSFTARVPRGEEALIAAAAQKANVQDNRYQAVLADYTALPGGVDSRVYALAVELTQHTNNAAEKAYAIQNHLAQNYRYTLDGGYPDVGEDFVSWFLLESKEGYCSYFASSMAVMCRIAGIPARYVEGYYIKAQPGGETIVTGENAHAWVEVYLNGLGWVAFDPTARAVEEQYGEDALDDSGTPPDHGSVDEPGRENPFQGNHEGEAEPSPSPDVGSNPDPTPTPNPDGDLDNPNDESDDSDGDSEDDPDDEPTPTPEPDDNDPPPPEDEPDSPEDNPDEQDEPDSDEDKPSRWWIWLIALVLLAAIALAVFWVKKRLADTDPLKLCVSTRSAQMAAVILYRSILTLLSQIGQAPQAGETPEAFAQRVTANLPNPDYEFFVGEVVRSRYSGKGITREGLNAGRRAYVVFLNGMRRSERIRYHVRRIFHGLGSFESIP